MSISILVWWGIQLFNWWIWKGRSPNYCFFVFQGCGGVVDNAYGMVYVRAEKQDSLSPMMLSVPWKNVAQH